MNRNVLLTDLGIAIVAAVLVLTLTPGLAIAAVIAIVVLIAAAISFRRDSRRRRAAREARRRDARPRASGDVQRAQRSNRTRSR